MGILGGAVVAQWIRQQTLKCEIPGSNLLAAAVVPLGKAFYPQYLVPQKELKTTVPLAFLVARSNKSNHIILSKFEIEILESLIDKENDTCMSGVVMVHSHENYMWR